MSLEKMIARQQELLNLAKAEGRELTDIETREYNELQEKIDFLASDTSGSTDTSGAEETDNNELSRAIEQAKTQERARVSSIRSMCSELKIADDKLNRFINDGMSIEQVRKEILDDMIAKGKPGSTQKGYDASVTTDERDKFYRAAGDAIATRAGIHVDNPAEGYRDLMGASLKDLAIKSLRDDGETGMEYKSAEDIFGMISRQFMNPTAAFPAMLDNVIDKAIVEGHKKSGATFEEWTKKGSLKDFKVANNNYLMGPAQNFVEVPEGGELKATSLDYEKLPTRKLTNHGQQFNLTMEAFINDDIELVARFPERYTAAAKRTINEQCYKILVNNPAIYDGVQLFDTAHQNVLATGSAITQEAMQKMMLALSTQKDQFDQSIIIRPATLVVPQGMAFEVYTLFNSPTINTTGNTQAVNPLYRYANQIKIVEDATINSLSGGFGNAMPWFLLGSKDDTDFIQVDYLNGQETPNFRRMEVSGRLGFVWDIWLPWGVSVMDYRGAIKNPGIVLGSPLV